MEIIIALVVIVVVGALVYFNRSAKSLDINNDGKVDLADAKAAVDNAVAGVTAAADVNNDGVVDAEDAKAAVENTVQGVKKQVRRAAKPKSPATVKTSKTRGRKPKKAE